MNNKLKTQQPGINQTVGLIFLIQNEKRKMKSIVLVRCGLEFSNSSYSSIQLFQYYTSYMRINYETKIEQNFQTTK